MSLGQLDDVVDLGFFDHSSANRALLYLWQMVLDNTTKVVLLGLPRHKPVPIEANEVESVVARVNADKIVTLREFLFIVVVLVLFFVFRFLKGELLKANSASAPARIVVFGQDIADVLVKGEKEAFAVFCLPLLDDLIPQGLVNFVVDFILLLVVDTLDIQLQLKSIEWIKLIKSQVANCFETDFGVVATRL